MTDASTTNVFPPPRTRRTPPAGPGAPVALRASTFRIILICVASMIVLTAVEIASPESLGRERGFTDFHIFRLVGGMVLNGEAATAYDSARFLPIQSAVAGFDSFMPWTYPPQMDLLVPGLAVLPDWLAYLALAVTGLTLWLLALRALAGEAASVAVVLTLPSMIINLRFGQNGLLTGAAVGALCLYWLRARPLAAGAFAGLMSCKPHLVIGLALAALLRRQWAMFAAATAVTGALAGLATLAFGPAIWGQFLAAVGESGHFLEEGRYPLFRMTSVYAMLRSNGLSADAAMALHGATALASLTLIGLVHLRGWSLRRLLVVSIVASLTISPYNYDYDLTIAAVALALAIPDLRAFARRGEWIALALASWLGTGWGLACFVLLGAQSEGKSTFAALGVLVMLGLLVRILHRAETATAAAPGAAHPA